MTFEPINYEAVIADLEAKIAHLQATLAGIRVVAGMGALGITPPSGPSGSGPMGGSKIAPNAFFGKSIPDAAVAVLGNVQKKLSTQELMEVMESGGLPKSKYNTVYAILRRRESQVGDIVNMQGEWGLAAWFPNHTKKAKKDAASAVPMAADDADDAFESDDDLTPEEAFGKGEEKAMA